MPNLRKCKGSTCGEMLPYWSRKLYCTNACKQKHYRMKKEPHYNVRNNPYKKRCINCGISFDSFTPLARHCSRACKQSFYRQQKQLRSTSDIPSQLGFPDDSYTISNTLV